MKGRFLYLTDSHWTRSPGVPPHKGVWQQELFDTHCERLEEAAVELIRRTAPDFVIHGGDLCREFSEVDWRNAKRVIDRFPCPCHFVAGNHDSQDAAHRRSIIEIFAIPERRLYYVRELGGLPFIFLDSSYLWTKDPSVEIQPTDPTYVSQNVKANGISVEQLKWFREQLERHRGRPVVVVTHIPIVGKLGYPVKYRKEKPITASVPVDPEWMVDIHGCWIMPLEERRAELLQMMRETRNVRLVLAGHMHASTISRLDGVVHCTTGSMSAWPFEMRLITYDDEGLTIETVQVDAPDLVEASYRPKWQNEWVAGMSEYDRSARIQW